MAVKGECSGHRTAWAGGSPRPSHGAKMGQTVRQSMPLNAQYAYMPPAVNQCRSQQPLAYFSKSPTYPYTIGVCLGRVEGAYL